MHQNYLLAAGLSSGLLLFVTGPLIVATIRHHPERGTIARLTPFGLVSFILWAALLTWALSDKRDDGIIGRYVARLRERKLLPVVVGLLVVIGAIGSAATFLR